MKQEPQLQLSWTGAVLCFLLYFAISFPTWSALSVSLYIPSISDERIAFAIDVFGFDHLTEIVSIWLSETWPDMPKPRTVYLGADMATKTSALILSLIVVVYSKRLIGCQIPLGKWRYEAILWIFAAVLFSTVFYASFSLPSNLADTTWSYFFGLTCARLLFRPDDQTHIFLVAYLAISPMILAPIAEEIADRGLLGEIFLRSLGPLPAAIITSVFFAIGHMTSNLVILTMFLTGLLLFAARIRFGGIGVPILMHMAINASIILPALYRC